jgi:hypothetical protein
MSSATMITIFGLFASGCETEDWPRDADAIKTI